MVLVFISLYRDNSFWKGEIMNKELVREFYTIFNSGYVKKYNDILCPDWVNHPEDHGREANIEGFKLGVQDMLAAFEGFELDIIQMIEEGENVACHIRMKGKHIRIFAGIAPSFQNVEFYGLDRHQIRNNKIINTWHFEDLSNVGRIK